MSETTPASPPLQPRYINLRIDWSTDNFQGNIHPIATVRARADKGSYTWRVAPELSHTVKIRVSDANNPAIFDVSNEAFTVTWSRADLTLDQRVNIQDLTLCALSFGAKKGEPEYNPVADANKDGEVNIIDLTTIALEFGSELTPRIQIFAPDSEKTITTASGLGFDIICWGKTEASTLEVMLNNHQINEALNIIEYSGGTTIEASFNPCGNQEDFEKVKVLVQYLTDGTNELRAGVQDTNGYHIETTNYFNVDLTRVISSLQQPAVFIKSIPPLLLAGEEISFTAELSRSMSGTYSWEVTGKVEIITALENVLTIRCSGQSDTPNDTVIKVTFKPDETSFPSVSSEYRCTVMGYLLTIRDYNNPVNAIVYRGLPVTLYLGENITTHTAQIDLGAMLGTGTDPAVKKTLLWEISGGIADILSGNLADQPYVTLKPTETQSLYTLAWGNDANGDGKIDNPQKLTVKAITDEEYKKAVDNLKGYADKWKETFPFAASLLYNFLDLSKQAPITPSSTTTQKIDVSKEPWKTYLTHKCGANFEGTVATVPVNIYEDGSEPSNKIENSSGLKNGVKSIREKHWKEIEDFFAKNPGVEMWTFSWKDGIQGLTFDSGDLFWSLHAADLHYDEYSITVTKGFLGSLKPTEESIKGYVEDLYDFNYDTSYVIDPQGLNKKGATAQLGWDPPKGHNAGGIFKTKVYLAHTIKID